MKVLLIALNAKYVHSNLAVRDIEAYAKKHSKYTGCLEVKEYTINQNLDSILQMIYKEKADIIAFSCYIWNIKEIISIAKEFHKISPTTKIWLGGPEVSYNSTEMLSQYDFLDGIIIGEGEATFTELLNKWESDIADTDKDDSDRSDLSKSDIGDYDYSQIAGIAIRDEFSVPFITGSRQCIPLDDIPFIYDDFECYKNKILYYESSRGCPFSCSYCLSSIDKTVRFRSIELVKRELQVFLDAKVPQVKFIDRTFNCKRDRAIEIWEYITDHDNGVTNFHFEISADLISEEEIKLFSRMRKGLIQLEIGLQSTNPDTIQEINRTMDIGKLKRNMLAIRNLNNIHQHLDLIAGLPYENYESFQKSFCDAYDMRPHQLQLGFLKVLKGSYMEEMKDEYNLVYHGEQPYEVMSTKWISYEEIILLKRVEEMVEVYHNSGQFDNVLKYLLTFFEDPFNCFLELGNFYEEHDLFNIGFKREARYSALRDFAKNKVSDLEIFDDLLIYDFYLRENAKSRPEFSKEEKIDKNDYQGFFKNNGTEKFAIDKELNIENYDSKVASRIMHMESISYDAYEKIINYNDLEKRLSLTDRVYCLFDYANRNPLSSDARVFYFENI